MPNPFRSIKHFRIQTFSVVSDPQPKKVAAISDLCFDSPSLGMAKSISQRLTRNPEDFNVDVWMQSLRRSFNHYTELYRIPIVAVRNEFFS
jgi:hypothetical protein